LKVNRLPFLNSDFTFNDWVEKIIAHNYTFSDVPYSIKGVAKNSNGEISVVLEQPLVQVDTKKPATQQEIDQKLTDLGFEKKKDGSSIYWTDGVHNVSDVEPKNVLKGTDGDLYFIDPYVVRTPVGDNSSKVVDENGEPMVVYHETAADWNIYDKSKENAGKFDYKTPTGIFAKSTDKKIGLGDRQVMLFMNAKNPKVFTKREDALAFYTDEIDGYAKLHQQYLDNDAKYKKQYDEAIKTVQYKLTELEESGKYKIPSPEWSKIVKEYRNGLRDIINKWGKQNDEQSTKTKELLNNYYAGSEFDGVIIQKDEGSWGRETDAFIVFHPNQIKSATGNAGTFSNDTDNINFQKKRKGKSEESENSLSLRNEKGETDYEKVREITEMALAGDRGLRSIYHGERRKTPESERRTLETQLILGGVRPMAGRGMGRPRATEPEQAKQQEKRLKDYAQREGIWLSEKDIADTSAKKMPSGKEADVYMSQDGQTVTKIINYKQYSKTPLDFTNERITLFNRIFPDTAYTLVGFTETDKGFSFVVEQPMIQGQLLSRIATLNVDMVGQQKRVNDFMEEQHGMKPDGLDAVGNEVVSVQDLHLKNVMEGADGKLYVIDAIPKIKDTSLDTGIEISEAKKANTTPVMDIAELEAVAEAQRSGGEAQAKQALTDSEWYRNLSPEQRNALDTNNMRNFIYEQARLVRNEASGMIRQENATNQ
ncbi:MAG: hypothetical protein Q4G08_06080, partial [Capnocytophaga sp.]|nr:hypothetical protein [Capnocytophaga sp.]